jgi:hypothetical protein
MSSNASFAAAERMRLYRKRRREDMQYVRVLLSAPDIDSLVRMGLLKQERRRDPEALQDAIWPFSTGSWTIKIYPRRSPAR